MNNEDKKEETERISDYRMSDIERGVFPWVKLIQEIAIVANSSEISTYYDKEDNFLEVTILRVRDLLYLRRRLNYRLRNFFIGDVIFKSEEFESGRIDYKIRLFPYHDRWIGHAGCQPPKGYVSRAYFSEEE